MSRALAIVLSSAALLVGALASVALAVEIVSTLVRPVSLSLRVGRHSVVIPPFHWSIYAAAACLALVAVVLLWRSVFPSRT